MMQRPTIASALAAESPLVTPLAHDALSARMIAKAGFRGFAIGGSALLATRFALPDIGLIGLQDMVEGIRDIAAATDLPFFADGDDGYGDAKSVVRMVDSYERIGVGAILIEDQHRDRKQQRADRALEVVDRATIEGKLRVALAHRRNASTFIIGRTDSFGVHGMDEALRRAERFLTIGVDGVFVAGLKSMQDYERVGKELRGARLSAAIFETPGMPWPTPRELGELGYAHVSYPATLLFRITAVVGEALRALRDHANGSRSMNQQSGADNARAVLDDALELGRWKAMEAEGAATGGTK